MDSRAFSTEEALVRQGRRAIRRALSRLPVPAHAKAEVEAPGCIPDVVIYRRQSSHLLYVVTIEFKLSNWRRALGQAFRHRNFGNEAYVVLDRARALPALSNLHAFEAANIGLASIDTTGSVEIWHYPIPRLPFSPVYSRELARALLAPRKRIPDALPFTRTIRGGVPMAALRDTLGTPAYLA